MYVSGGCVRGSTLKYDSAQDTWSEVAPMPEVRYSAAACAIGNDVYVFGRSCQVLHGGFVDTKSAFMYNTEVDNWIILPPMPLTCSHHSVSILGGLVYIVSGGYVLRFNPASGEWKTLAPTLIGHAEWCSFVAIEWLPRCSRG
jgi:N-acetylneuraminic acid mutarotase